MAVAKRVMEAIEKMAADDFEAALIPASIAVDATAAVEYPDPKNHVSYKAFLKGYLPLITHIAFGGVSIHNLNIGYEHPQLKPDAQGVVSVEQILYHVVRCGLLHAAKLPETIRFTNKGKSSLKEGVLTLPAGFVYGLITAVVASPVNKAERTPPGYDMNHRGTKVPLNDLWGDRAKIEAILGLRPA